MKDNNKTRTDIDAALAEVGEKAKAFTAAHQGETAEEILAAMRGEEPASEEEQHCSVVGNQEMAMRTPIDDIRDLMAHAGEDNPHEIRAKLEERLKNKLNIKED